MGEKCFEAEYLPFSLATTTSSLMSSEGLQWKVNLTQAAGIRTADICHLLSSPCDPLNVLATFC